MNRPTFLCAVASLATLAALGHADAALADGTVSITNATIDGPVTVQGKIGNSLDDAVGAGSQTIKKGETALYDSSNLRLFWRREANPGTGDGAWTEWKTVDARDGDQHVSF